MKKYFPILKSKRGEFGALGLLSELIKKEVAPIVEVLPGYGALTLEKLPKIWSFEGNELLLDFSYTITEDDFNVASLQDLVNGLLNEGVNVVLVVEFGQPLEYLRSISQLDIRKCIRVRRYNLNTRDFNIKLQQLNTVIPIDKELTKLLIDLECINENTVGQLIEVAVNNLDLASESNWNQIIISSGSFPVDLAQIERDTQVHLPRVEAQLWAEICRRNNNKIYYSDYGTRYPIYQVTNDKRFPSASIRYTTKETYFIIRGILAVDSPLGYGQYNEHSRLLVQHPAYDGSYFSQADARIHWHSLPENSSTPGGPEEWIKISQARHISKLCDLL